MTPTDPSCCIWCDCPLDWHDALGCTTAGCLCTAAEADDDEDAGWATMKDRAESLWDATAEEDEDDDA